jgi:hypothetical protein
MRGSKCGFIHVNLLPAISSPPYSHLPPHNMHTPQRSSNRKENLGREKARETGDVVFFTWKTEYLQIMNEVMG